MQQADENLPLWFAYDWLSRKQTEEVAQFKPWEVLPWCHPKDPMYMHVNH